jgi:hypothetical protein
VFWCYVRSGQSGSRLGAIRIVPRRRVAALNHAKVFSLSSFSVNQWPSTDVWRPPGPRGGHLL